MGARGDRAVARFLVAYNTLGAVYHKHGDLAQAEAVLRFVLAREPANTQAMANLVRVLADAGQADESERLAAQRSPDWSPSRRSRYFNRGMAAMRAGDLHAAKASFEREIARSPDYHEFHFWLAVAHIGLGEAEAARRHLAHRDEEQHDPQRPRHLRRQARPLERDPLTRWSAPARRRVAPTSYNRSMIAAMPWPPPMHIVMSP